MSVTLSARSVSVTISGRPIIENIDLDVAEGELLAIVGPNGAGKSTLLKALAGDIRLSGGSVRLNGRRIGDWTLAERARQRAVLPQTPELAFSFRAWDVVELGRHPHLGRASPTENSGAIAGAMAATDVDHLATRDCRTLSGGEMHRVHFARVLAQLWSAPSGFARVLLLDEPTSSLDLFHQHAILAKAVQFSRYGAAVVAVLHDLNLAAAYAGRVAVLDAGQLDCVAAPAEAFCANRISRIWRVACDVTSAASGGRPQITVRPILQTTNTFLTTTNIPQFDDLPKRQLPWPRTAQRAPSRLLRPVGRE